MYLRLVILLVLVLLLYTGATAQTEKPLEVASGPTEPGATSEQPQDSPATRQITMPAGTTVLLELKNTIDTRSARVGDGVYCQTTLPLLIDSVLVIPSGSYVKGAITRVKRAGRFRGRAEILFHFDSIIFPNGYTVDMPGFNLRGDPGTYNGRIVDEEGTVKTEGHDKLKKLGTVIKDTALGGAGGLAIGTIGAGNLNGARIGAVAGAGAGLLVGLATVLLPRGSDVRIEKGAALTMQLQRPLVVDVNATSRPVQYEVIPRQTNTRLPLPANSNKQQ